MYLRGKRDLNYAAAIYDFHGRFYEFYPLSQEKYRGLKEQALLSRKEIQEKKLGKKEVRADIALYLLNKRFGMTQEEISTAFLEHGYKFPQTTVSDCIKRAIPIENPPNNA